MEIQYNQPIEVTEAQYNRIMIHYSGICFGKKENGKFFIKLGMSKYKELIEKELSKV